MFTTGRLIKRQLSSFGKVARAGSEKDDPINEYNESKRFDFKEEE